MPRSRSRRSSGRRIELVREGQCTIVAQKGGGRECVAESGRCRSITGSVLSVLVLALVAGQASANGRISLSPTGVEARGAAITFTDEGGAARVICQLSMTLSLARSIVKTASGSVGNVTAADARSCSGGTIRLLAPEVRRPWPIKYVSFTGTLPRITSVRFELERVALLVEAFFGIARCLYSGSVQGTTVGSPVTELRLDETRSVALLTNLGGVECPRTGSMRGTLRVGSTVRMTLVECGEFPTADADISFEGREDTRTPAVSIHCDGVRINGIRTNRPEVFAIADRERAIGSAYRRGQSFRYDLILRDQAGEAVYRDEVHIDTNDGSVITRITFRNT